MHKTRMLGLAAAALMAVSGLAQKQVALEQPDSKRTKEEFVQILEKYPPAVRAVLSLDSALVTNKEYLEPYPALAAYLGSHPEVARDPAYFVGTMGQDFHFEQAGGWDRRGPVERILSDIGVFAGFGMAIGLLTWLVRTLINYRRWHRLATVQTNVHTKLLDRFTSNEDLLSYMQSPSGSKFLESSPISLDPGPRSIGAPFSRILWSVQIGCVLLAAGLGFRFAGRGLDQSATQALEVLGTLGMALGAGFVGSAGVSYVISRRLGLLESKVEAPLSER